MGCSMCGQTRRHRTGTGLASFLTADESGKANVFAAEHDILTLIPNDAWWACAWWLGHPEVDLSVDICISSRWERIGSPTSIWIST
jgi:hypothetical protein